MTRKYTPKKIYNNSVVFIMKNEVLDATYSAVDLH